MAGAEAANLQREGNKPKNKSHTEGGKARWKKPGAPLTCGTTCLLTFLHFAYFIVLIIQATIVWDFCHLNLNAFHEKIFAFNFQASE